MAFCGKEFLSLLFYRFCNPKRSDYKIEEHVEEVEVEVEVEEEAEGKRFEAELKRPEAELNRLRSTLEDRRGPSEEKAEFCLPSDLLVDILSRLALKDNIRSSAVCKTWEKIAVSVRVRDPPCWLMYLDPFHASGVFYGFFDPIEKKKTKAMNLPQLSKSSFIVYSNDGWLLMGDHGASRVNLFFFNPFTQECINLPSIGIGLMKFAFSCAPTKKSCLVFGIANGISNQAIKICTWHHGATTWVHEDFSNLFPFYLGRNVLYSNDGLFYISLGTALGVFDPCSRTWNAIPIQPTPGLFRHTIGWITEYKGEIFSVASYADPKVFRLNRLESVWEKNERLDGWSIFVSNGSCVMTYGSMSNIVYVWDTDINGRRPTKYECSFKWNRPYKYSLYSRSLCEDPEGYYFEYRARYRMDGVWIEPPQDISISDFSILPTDAINMRQFI